MREKRMKQSTKWLIAFFATFVSLLIFAGAVVYQIDPYFHYHAPNSALFYPLNNQRSQNDGIAKHFSYNALITGTSMTENFRTSEINELFQMNAIKLPFEGGSYKEINDSVCVAVRNQPELTTVFRCLDMNYFLEEKNQMRYEKELYPTYLYNANPLDDVKYLYNGDVLFDRCWNMIQLHREGFPAGITSFDDYSNWMSAYVGQFGADYVLRGHERFSVPEMEKHLDEEQRDTIAANISQNVTDVAKKNPDIEFYYFFPPYSVVWWGEVKEKGNLRLQLEAEQIIIEMILECDNIYLYSFNTFDEITTNLDNYKDVTHYGEWINTKMLEYMSEKKGLLTKENYREYLQKEEELYRNFDYNRLF